MTADPGRRRRQTRRGAVAAVVLVVCATIAVFVGASTLRTSEAGSAPETDTRITVSFPSTPTIAIGVVDDENRLASLVVGAVSPLGVGGSIITVPVNVDSSIGFGETRSPLSSRPYTTGDDESAEALTIGLESILSITVQHTLILGPDEVQAVVEPFAPFEVDLPDDVIDSDSESESDGESGDVDDNLVAAAGAEVLDADVIARVLTAIDVDGATYSHHDVDVSVWRAIAAAATNSPLDGEPVLDADGRPVDPTTADETLDRLLSGQVAHRDLAIDRGAAAEADNPDGVDFVLADRADALLVFGEIAPGLVSKPNESLSFQIIARFTDEQVAIAGDDATTAGLMQDLIRELLFAQGNVVSVQTSPASDGAAEITRLEVADEGFVDAVREVAPVLFGEVEVEVSTRVIEGVDVVAVLGTSFLERRAEIAVEIAATSTTEPERDADAEPVDDGDESVDDEVGSETTDQSDATPDTVAADE